jgi:hypothetical protein
VVRQFPRKKDDRPDNFFLSPFQCFLRTNRQDLCCSANDGFAATSIHCPYSDCRAAVQSDYIAGIWEVPRLILYLPFVLLPTLFIVVGTCGIGLIFWQLLIFLLSLVYCLPYFLRWPLRFILFKKKAFSFYDTNEAEKFSSFS